MPDDRLFHKRLGHSEKVNSLSDFEELVWRCYIMSADDFGVMRFAAVALQADSDRMANKPAKTIQKALERIASLGLVEIFEHQGRTYAFQSDWQDWQRVEYPRSTVNPAPPIHKLTEATKKLFAKHPGGFGRKRGGGSANVPQTSDEHPPNVRETFDGRSEESRLEPLAVSHKPLAVSRVQEPSANARSKHPVFKGQRFVVFDWMLEDLARMLGPHTEAFNLHEWFYQLDAEAVAANVLVPQRDGGKWLQERTQEEALKRGISLAPTVTNNPKTAGNLAAAARFIARG